MLKIVSKFSVLVALSALAVAHGFAQKAELTIVDFVGVWELGKRGDAYYAEIKISEIDSGIEIESKTYWEGEPIERKEIFHLDGRGEENKSPSGTIEHSTTKLHRGAITITYYHVDKKSNKKRDTMYVKYQMRKGKLVWKKGLFGYSYPSSPVSGFAEQVFTRKST